MHTLSINCVCCALRLVCRKTGIRESSLLEDAVSYHVGGNERDGYRSGSCYPSSCPLLLLLVARALLCETLF